MNDIEKVIKDFENIFKSSTTIEQEHIKNITNTITNSVNKTEIPYDATPFFYTLYGDGWGTIEIPINSPNFIELESIKTNDYDIWIDRIAISHNIIDTTLTSNQDMYLEIKITIGGSVLINDMFIKSLSMGIDNWSNQGSVISIYTLQLLLLKFKKPNLIYIPKGSVFSTLGELSSEYATSTDAVSGKWHITISGYKK